MPPFVKGQSGNLKGRPRFDSTATDHTTKRHNHYRADGWYSMLSGLGTLSKDKRQQTQFCADIVSYDAAFELWRGDDLAARIVETLPNEMTREGFDFCVAESAEGNDENYGKELSEKVAAQWENLNLLGALVEALCYERAYGGAAIMLGAIDNSATLEEPLNEKAVREFKWLTVLEPRELHPIQWYTNPRAPKFGQPEIYQFTPIITGAPKPDELMASTNVKIHESRLIVFGGTRVTRMPMRGTYGAWGDGVFTRVCRVLRDFNVSWGAAGILVADFAQPVFKIEDLAKIMEKDNKELFQARMAAIALSMSTARAVLIDKNEEYKREQTPVTGLPELLELFCKRLAAAADMPVSVLFGESPGGINASGASSDQVRMFYDRVRSMQIRKLLPVIKRITSLILATMGGAPDNWSIKFRPLWQETTKEKLESRKLQMEIDTGYYNIGSASDQEIRRARFGGDEFGYDLQVEIDDPNDLTGEPTPEDVAAYKASLAGTAPADPNAPAPTPGTAGAGSSDIQKEALNGAQVTSLIEVVTNVATKVISRQSGQQILMLAFQLSSDAALALLGPEDFEPAKEEPKPSPFGGGSPAPFPSGKKPADPAAKPENLPAQEDPKPGTPAP